MATNCPKTSYPIYDLQKESERNNFARDLIDHSFVLVHIPQQYKASLSNLFDVFEKLFKSKKSLECEVNSHYVGYTSTQNVKQSLWFYLNEDETALWPQLKDKNALLNQKKDKEKVVNAFNDYNEIAEDAIRAIFKYHCKEKQSNKCFQNLFSQNQNDDSKNDSKQSKNYRECEVYHRYRKEHNLSLNNLAAIQYYGRKKGIFEKLKKEKEESHPCEEHMDYTVVTLIMSNEPGLQCRDIETFDMIDVDEIIRSHNVDSKEVLLVITGKTSEALFEKIACQHQVKHSYKEKDRLSFPLFCYAHPNGTIDTSLIKRKRSTRLPNSQKVICSDYVADNMLPSVNFKR